MISKLQKQIKKPNVRGHVVKAEDSFPKDRGFELDLMEAKLARILKK